MRGRRHAREALSQMPSAGSLHPEKDQRDQRQGSQVARREEHQFVDAGVAPEAAIEVEKIENNQAQQECDQGIHGQVEKVEVETLRLAIQAQEQRSCRV